jgi:LysR family transcriptional activator of dmlA
MITAQDGPLLAAFSAVVRCGSFSAAALDLVLSKSVVSERVRALERRAGARLLERTTRKLRLTEAGADVLAAATRVDDALDAVSLKLDASGREPAGLLRIATTNDLGSLLVAPVVARLVTTYAKVRVEVLVEDASRDMLEAKLDVAVRLGAPKDSSFVARKLAVLGEPVVASPSLAERLGAVERPRDLAGAPWVRHALLAPGPMRFEGPAGASDVVAAVARAEANSGATLLSLLVHGAGVGVLPEHALREALREGRLVDLCPGWLWKRVSLYALTPSRSDARPAVAVFLSMLEEQVRADRARWGSIARAGR